MLMKTKRQTQELNKDDFYYSVEGNVVFTKKYHLKRGYCCDCDCKHCPYVNNKNSQNLTL